jgi:hypothetical protein
MGIQMLEFAVKLPETQSFEQGAALLLQGKENKLITL